MKLSSNYIKKLFPFVFLFIFVNVFFLVCFVNKAKADLPDYEIKYEFNETEGVVAEDTSGNDRDGEVSDGVTVGSAGYDGSAYNFNGSTGAVTVDDFAYGDGSSGFAVSFWFKVADNSGDGYQYLYSHGSWSDNNTVQVALGREDMIQEVSNKLFVRFADSNDIVGGSFDNLLYVEVDSDELNLIDDEWHQVVFSAGPTKGARLYVDGELVDSYVNRGTDSFNPSSSVTFATRNYSSSNRYFSGSMDKAYVFSGELTSSQVKDFFDSGTNDSSLEFELKFDEASGIVASDNTGNGHAGLIDGDISMGVLGHDNTSYEFNCDKQGKVLVDDFYYGSDFSVNLWFRATKIAGSGYQYLFSHGNAGEKNNLNIFLAETGTPTVGGELVVNYFDENDSTTGIFTNLLSVDATESGLDLIDGDWHMLTFVVDAENGARLYIDNVQRDTEADRGGNYFNPNSQIYIGTRSDNPADRYFNGTIDEVRLYKGALTDNEIDELYASSLTSTNITIDDYTDKKVYQRISGVADVSLSGTYTGAPVAIEARVINYHNGSSVSGWQTVDDSPDNGVWSGTIENVPEGGWYKIEARHTNNTNNFSNESNRFGVGVIIGMIGQSNMSRMFTQSDSPDPVNERVYAYGYDDEPRDNSEAVSSWFLPTANGAIKFANSIVEQLEVPVLLLDYAVPGSYINEWSNSEHGTWQRFSAGITTLDSDLEFVIFHQGAADALNNISKADYKTHLDGLLTNIENSLSINTKNNFEFLLTIQNRGNHAGDNDSGYTNVRSAQMEWANQTEKAYLAVNSVDIDLIDAGHFSAVDYEILADRYMQTVLSLLSEVGYSSSGIGPDFLGGIIDNNEVILTVEHNGGNNLQLIDSQADIEGFVASQNNWESELMIESAIILDNDQVKLVFSETPVEDVEVKYLYGMDPFSAAEAGNLLYDNFSYGSTRSGLPVNPTIDSLTITDGLPEISALTVSSGEDAATISWESSTNCSSRVDYGPTNNYEITGVEQDTSPRLKEHSVDITGLASCAKYHYRVYSVDEYANVTTTEDATFITNGCAGDASIISFTEETIGASGGSVENNTFLINVESGSLSSDNYFQVFALDSTIATSEIGNPDNYQLIGDYGYEINAFANDGSLKNNFNENLTVVISYEDSQVVNLDETFLKIFRHDGGQWYELDNCNVDSDNNTVTCTTNQFSTFALFAESINNNQNTNNDISGGGGLPVDYKNPPHEPKNGFYIKPIRITDGKVKLDINGGPEAKRMALSEDVKFKYAPLLSYQEEYVYDFSPGLGEKTIYAKFYNKYGYASPLIQTTFNYKTDEKKEEKKKEQEVGALAKRLKGKFLLDVENGGAIWYVNPINFKRYLITWCNALPFFEKHALGISNLDLMKIRVSGSGKKIVSNLGEKLKGRFLLAVQDGGAIWYVDNDGERHSITWDNLLKTFKTLSLGINSYNLEKINVGY